MSEFRASETGLFPECRPKAKPTRSWARIKSPRKPVEGDRAAFNHGDVPKSQKERSRFGFEEKREGQVLEGGREAAAARRRGTARRAKAPGSLRRNPHACDADAHAHARARPRPPTPAHAASQTPHLWDANAAGDVDRPGNSHWERGTTPAELARTRRIVPTARHGAGRTQVAVHLAAAPSRSSSSPARARCCALVALAALAVVLFDPLLAAPAGPLLAVAMAPRGPRVRRQKTAVCRTAATGDEWCEGRSPSKRRPLRGRTGPPILLLSPPAAHWSQAFCSPSAPMAGCPSDLPRGCGCEASLKWHCVVGFLLPSPCDGDVRPRTCLAAGF